MGRRTVVVLTFEGCDTLCRWSVVCGGAEEALKRRNKRGCRIGKHPYGIVYNCLASSSPMFCVGFFFTEDISCCICGIKALARFLYIFVHFNVSNYRSCSEQIKII